MGVPCSSGEEPHVKAKLGEGIQNSFFFPCHLVPMALLSSHGSSLLISDPAPLGRAVSPQMAAPASYAAGRTGWDNVSSSAVEGGCGPTTVSWVPEPRALVLGSHSG